MSITELIEEHRAEIMNGWAEQAERAASARGLSQPELRNVLPLYLQALSAGEGAADKMRGHLETHLADRIRQGFDLSEIVEEFVLLERCVSSVWGNQPAGHQPEEADRQAFSEAIQRTIVQVTQLFHEHMQLDEQREKRYLRLLQAIADEALQDPNAPLAARLQEVLEVIMDATQSQSASLLLYDPEGERILYSAAAGLAEKELEQYATGLGPDTLRGQIASRPEPTQVADIETTELSVSEPLRHSGIHALLGIRLPQRHKLMSLLYIGLSEKRSFSAREVRRLEAMGDRLTLHLDNARLFADLRAHIRELILERELRERFVAILAHDLRGPISAAKMSSQLLIRNPERHEQRRDLAVRIEHNLDRMDRMIRDLLDVSRASAGQRLPLRLDSCDLGVVAEEVIEELSVEHGDRFELFVPGVVRGIWSYEELRRALWNLGVNAVKYGASDAQITMRVERTPIGARVSVHNVGNPIEPEKKEQLFDLYSRLTDSTPPSGGGWGLGLPLVRASTEAHGGRVYVQSSKEAGTTFTIELPLDSRPFQNAPAPETPRSDEDETTSRGSQSTRAGSGWGSSPPSAAR